MQKYEKYYKKACGMPRESLECMTPMDSVFIGGGGILSRARSEGLGSEKAGADLISRPPNRIVFFKFVESFPYSFEIWEVLQKRKEKNPAPDVSLQVRKF